MHVVDVVHTTKYSLYVNERCGELDALSSKSFLVRQGYDSSYVSDL